MKRRNFIASTLGLASVGAIQASPSPQTSPREFKLGDFTYQKIDDTRYVKIDSIGNKFYYMMDLLHREDGPAIEFHDGTGSWYKKGQLHRENGPAVEGIGGTREWWTNGKRHREDEPAFEYSNGKKEWWLNGVYQRSEYWNEGKCILISNPTV